MRPVTVLIAVCSVFVVTIPITTQQLTALSILIPFSNNTESNEYQCKGMSVPLNASYIVRFEPMINTSLVHHMLLYGCQLPYSHDDVWDCKAMFKLCSVGQPYILFGWGRNASGVQLPNGVGFKVRGDSHIDWLILQLHYADMPKDVNQLSGSANGLTVQLTYQPKPLLAGVYLLAAATYKPFPPSTNVINLDLACQHSGDTIVPFAYRVHAHSLGVKITGYVVKHGGEEWVEIGSGNPRNPQAFYPSTSNITVTSGDYLAARCVYSSIGISHVTNLGSDTNDEMCNFYFMYSTHNDPSAVSFDQCSSPAPVDLEFPEPYTCPDIVPPIDWQKKEGLLSFDHHWILNNVAGSAALPLLGVALGQVTAVQARSGHVYVLHRGVAEWNTNSFNQSNYFLNVADGPIKQSTVLELNSSGHLISQWGENMFYMPHGLTIDSQLNYWITDVAMHQVFKFTPQREKILELGVAFSPGSDHNHFCKPASVAVDSETGVVFVADGYCNSRIVLYSPAGEYLMEQNAAVNSIGLKVVHKLVIVERLGQLLVVDRENGRILSYQLQNMHFLWSMTLPRLGRAIYSIDVNDSSSGLHMFAVATPTKVGITVDQSGVVLDQWGPPSGFIKPHDVAIDTDGSAVYVVEIGPNRIWKFVQRSVETGGANTTRLSIVSSAPVISLSVTPSNTSTKVVSTSLDLPSTTTLATHIHSHLNISTSSSNQSFSAVVTSSQSHFIITSTPITSSVLSYSSVQLTNSSVVVSVTSSLLSATVFNVSSNTSSEPDTSTLQVVALLLTAMVVLVTIVIVTLTVKYCYYGNWSQSQKVPALLYANGHRRFSKVRTFDPDDVSDVDDEELTVFTKF